MMGMETYNGQVRTPADAIILFEACRIGLLPRVQRRLSEKERQSIKSGSVFVWDEREAGMRRWTDGKSWSASRVSGSFLTYREMEGKRGGSSFEKNANRDGVQDGQPQQQNDSDGGPDGYRYKPDGLMKQSFSITTNNGQHLHLISYFSRASSNAQNLIQPTNDPQLRHIRPEKGMYPESTVHEQSTIPAVTQGPMGSPSYAHTPHQAPYARPPPYAYGPHPGWPPSPMPTPPPHPAYASYYPPHGPYPGHSPLQNMQYPPPYGQPPPMTAFDRPPPPMANGLPPPPPGQYGHAPPNGYHHGYPYPASGYHSYQPPPLHTPQSQAQAPLPNPQPSQHSQQQQQQQQPPPPPPQPQSQPPQSHSSSSVSSCTESAQQNADGKRQDSHQPTTAPASEPQAQTGATASPPPQTSASGTTIPSISAMLNGGESGQTPSKSGNRSSTSPRPLQDIPMHKLGFEASRDVQALRNLDKTTFKF
ncbi:camp independent regulatory protein [Hortaea werneckii]|nr:camp independent regulatory protein [Hortaea werneckii]